MKKIAAAALVATGILSAGASVAHDSSALAVYAGFAKLNENIAEAAGAVMFGTHADAGEALRAEAIEDFRGDLAQLDGYIAKLRGMPLNPSQRSALESVAKDWAAAADAAEKLIDGKTATPDAVSAWWESLDDIDDTVDDVLDAILRSENITS